ncbi:DUF4244 domain-containing protein [Paenarthrobacter sp. Z7-10]|nr:DUF4244 domain-containing protein [Paenarthrobacter sp. Z7-10]
MTGARELNGSEGGQGAGDGGSPDREDSGASGAGEARGQIVHEETPVAVSDDKLSPVREIFAGAASRPPYRQRVPLRRRSAEAGMATAEYAIATLAAVGFAGLLVVILKSDEVRGFLLSIIRSALSMP